MDVSKIIDCGKIANGLLQEYSEKIKLLKDNNIIPTLKVIRFHNDQEDSKIFNRVRKKLFDSYNCNINETEISVYQHSYNDIMEIIDDANNDDNIHGIIIDRPIPSCFKKYNFMDNIISSKDVDCLSIISNAKYLFDDKYTMPCTTEAALRILDNCAFGIIGKHIVVLGRGNYVGKPLINVLINKGAIVTACNSNTSYEYMIKLLTNADIIISCTGIINLIKPEFVTEKSIVIDLGISKLEDTTVGDCHPDIYDKVSMYTPVPNGIGKITNAVLLRRVVNNAMKNIIQKG